MNAETKTRTKLCSSEGIDAVHLMTSFLLMILILKDLTTTVAYKWFLQISTDNMINNGNGDGDDLATA